MRFLTVADRELRSAARQKATYRIRWITAVGFFGLLLYLLWLFNGFSNVRVAPDVFRVYAVFAFLYCLLLSASRTADAISAERRDGTLGLLFLTNLNSAEIIAGKLCSTALASIYGLLAIFPMLALPMLMGGITFADFTQTLLGLLNGILFALAIGFLVSVLCRRQFIAVALALGLTFGLSGGVMLGAVALDSFPATRGWANEVAVFSPFYTLITADGSMPFGGLNHYWESAAIVAAFSLASLALTTLLLARSWRDRPGKLRSARRPLLRRILDPFPRAARAALRRRLLDLNPLCWLAGRQTVSAPVFMLLATFIFVITSYVLAPMWGRGVGAGTASPVLGHMIAWLCSGLGIHALVLYYAAMTASQRLAEDKETGALELILSTPANENTISRGLWLAFGRRMLFPALLAVLVHVFFIYVCLTMAVLDPPGNLPRNATPGEIFWAALLERPLRGTYIDWEFGFLLRAALLVLLLFVLTWPTLGWVGRWLGLRMKHPGFAPVASLALLIVPPVLTFSLLCYLADEFNLDRLPERQFIPIIMWLGFGIGCAHCLLLALWARGRLRDELRAVAMSRYQPLPRWRLPRLRTVRRFAIGSAALAFALTLLVMGYYRYQNWRSQRDWRTFVAVLKQTGVRLDISTLLPPPVPATENLAESPVFLRFLSRTNEEITAFFDRNHAIDVSANYYQPNTVFMDWHRQTNSSLQPLAFGTARGVPGAQTKEPDAVAALLREFQPHSAMLQDLAVAAEKSAYFQTATNRDLAAIFGPDEEKHLLLTRLHLLFQARACALLRTNGSDMAAGDVLTGLHLARLAKQIPDLRSGLRVQWLLTRSFQPLYEGLTQQAWSEPQLAAIQEQLAGFDVFADYTNLVHRTVFAHIEAWRAIPGSTNKASVLPSVAGFANQPIPALQPDGIWYDHCIQLYNAGQRTIRQVDFASGRLDADQAYSSLNGLPLMGPTWEVFHNAMWTSPSGASVAFVQTSLNQAIIACALERFRLASGSYPETLNELVPGLLPAIPRDAVSGRPIIYQRLNSDSFILRGVGSNALDDRKSKSSDDWLWMYPTNAVRTVKP